MMKSKISITLTFFVLIFSCNNEQKTIKDYVNSFKDFSDSLLLVNKNYVEVLYADTMLVSDMKNDELVGFDLNDTIISLHSNIFDTFTDFSKNKMAATLAKYNSFELKLDTLKSKMDDKTLKLFEGIKQNINTIKQPIK